MGVNARTRVQGPAVGLTGVPDQRRAGGGAPCWPFNPLLAVLAVLAALFFVFPLIGMITGAPWGNVFGIITSKSSLDALGLSIIASLASTVIALLFGFPAGLAAGAQYLPRQGGGARADHLADGAAAGGRRHRAAAGLRPSRVHRPAAGPGVRDLATVHPGRGHRGRVVRGHAVLRDHGGVRAALDEPAAGGRRPQPGSATPDRLPPGDAAAHLALARGRHGADLGPALGEFGATITFAGNLPGRTQTMPLAIYVSQSSGQVLRRSR